MRIEDLKRGDVVVLKSDNVTYGMEFTEWDGLYREFMLDSRGRLVWESKINLAYFKTCLARSNDWEVKYNVNERRNAK